MQPYALAPTNVTRHPQHELERWAGVAMATAVMAFGLSRRSMPGVVLAAAAAPLAYRSLTGEWPGLANGLAHADTRVALAGSRGVHVREAVRLERPRDEVYAFWRRLENLPRFMDASAVGDRSRRRTVALGRRRARPAPPVEWDAEIVNELEGRGDRRGARCPAPTSPPPGRCVSPPSRQGRSTQVSVHLQYAAPGGGAGRLLALAARPRPRAHDSRGSAPLQAAARSRRSPARDERSGRMKAVCYYGKAGRAGGDACPDPEILNPRDAIIRVTATAICGSDLHIYGGYIPTMQKGDILGHEFMGEVVDVGRENTRLKIGDRVVVPFTIACGRCFFCKEQLWSLCDNSNPERLDGREAVRLLGVRALRLLAHVRRLSRRPGGVRAGAVCRRRAAARAGFAHRRAGAVSLRHLSHRLHGRRELPDQAGRHGRRLGLRAGRAVRDPERLPARGRAGHRDRPLPGAPGAGRVVQQGRGARLLAAWTCRTRCAR